MWDLWFTKWHWDRFFSKFFGFTMSISFHNGSPHSCITCGLNNTLTGGHSSETQSHPIKMNNMGGLYSQWAGSKISTYANLYNPNTSDVTLQKSIILIIKITFPSIKLSTII
jgi:hypothetical protein